METVPGRGTAREELPSLWRQLRVCVAAAALCSLRIPLPSWGWFHWTVPPRVVPPGPVPTLVQMGPWHRRSQFPRGCRSVPTAASSRSCGGQRGAGLLTPAESQGISRLWEQTGTRGACQRQAHPDTAAVEPLCAVHKSKAGAGPRDSHPSPISLGAGAPQGLSCPGRTFPGEAGPFPRDIPPSQGLHHQRAAQPCRVSPLVSHQPRALSVPLGPWAGAAGLYRKRELGWWRWGEGNERLW